jgi:hypothetical protein
MAERGEDRENLERGLVALLGSMADFFCDLLFSFLKKVNPTFGDIQLLRFPSSFNTLPFPP